MTDTAYSISRPAAFQVDYILTSRVSRGGHFSLRFLLNGDCNMNVSLSETLPMLVRLSLNAHDQYELQPVLVQWQGYVPVLVQWQRAVQPWSTLRARESDHCAAKQELEARGSAMASPATKATVPNSFFGMFRIS